MSVAWSRRALCWSAFGLCFARPASTAYAFWVLRLLYPRKLIVKPLGTARLHCVSGESTWVIEGNRVASVGAESLAGGESLRISGPGGSPADFVVEIPDVMRRSYRGLLQVSGDGEVLRPVVTMDGETATGSIVGAELPVSAAPFDALAAQAVATRSVLMAGIGQARHGDADFCDTTHCQFLRSPAKAGSAVERAVEQTAGIVLEQDGRILSAQYSGACGGLTQGGLRENTLYSSVVCEPCRTAGRERQGHGWGMCQQGAMDLARRGASWRRILAIYYPGAGIRWQTPGLAAKNVSALKHL